MIIPDFGGLISQYTPVRIHPVRHSMAPPAKRVAFNEKLQQNDGRLIAHISLKEQLSTEDAAVRVSLFVQAVNQALHQHQRYQLQEVGLFRKEPGQPIAFEFEEKINLLADSFGLPEVFSKPIQRHRSLSEIRTAVSEKVTPKLHSDETARTIPLWKKTLRYAAILPILALSASALYLATLDSGLELSNLNPVSFLLKQRPAFSGTSTAANTFQVRQLSAEEHKQFISAFELRNPVENAAPVYLTDQFLPAQTAEELAFPSEATAVEQTLAETSDWDTPAETIAEAANPVVDRATPVSSGFTAPTIINERTNRFYIIAGGFIETENAEQLQKRAQKNGLDAKIIEPEAGSRLHRVSLADFDTREQALAQVASLTPTYGKALWVLEY